MLNFDIIYKDKKSPEWIASYKRALTPSFKEDAFSIHTFGTAVGKTYLNVRQFGHLIEVENELGGTFVYLHSSQAEADLHVQTLREFDTIDKIN